MDLPQLESFAGPGPREVTSLVNYGYRAAWKVATPGGTFVVKSDIRPGAQQAEYDNHAYAALHGLPVPALLGLAQGEQPVMALRWVEGESLDMVKSPAAWRNVGSFLRQLHALPPRYARHELPPRFPRHQSWSAFLIDWFSRELDYMVASRGLLAAERAAALDAVIAQRTLLDSIDGSWIHGDCQAAHFLIDPATDEVAAVIDWSDAQPGAPDMDLAVLTLFDRARLPHILHGYGASPAMRERLAVTLPIHAAVRAAGAARWLDEHGSPGHDWPLRIVRHLARISVATD